MDNISVKAKTTTNPKLYLDFFKSYYREKTRVLVIITTVIGCCCVLAGLFFGARHTNVYLASTLAAGGAVLAIYPRFSYLRPYRSVKNNVITTVFEFYDDRLVEINDASREEYKYSDLLKVWETSDCFYIYHNKESASVVEKSGITLGTPESLARLLAGKLPYKLEKR